MEFRAGLAMILKVFSNLNESVISTRVRCGLYQGFGIKVAFNNSDFLGLLEIIRI